LSDINYYTVYCQTLTLVS